MGSIAVRFAKYLRASAPKSPSQLFVLSMQSRSKTRFSSLTSDDKNDTLKNKEGEEDNGAVENKIGEDDDDHIFSNKIGEDDDDHIFSNNVELQPQGVDPRRGWGFRGVHKAIICGKIGQAPVQKILRNGRTVTIFTVGTGGMFDQRIAGGKDLPKPAQWHRIAVHNEALGAYAVQQLVKNASVYIEGDIETRVYNDSIHGDVKNVPEICVRRDGKVRLIKSGQNTSNISFDDLKEGLI